MFEILDIALLACFWSGNGKLMQKQTTTATTISIQISKVLPKCQWSSTVMSKYAPQNSAHHFFFGHSTKSKMPCLFVRKPKKKSHRDRESDYTRWLTAKKFCLHSVHFQHFFVWFENMQCTSDVACIMLCCSGTTITTTTRTHNIIAFLSFAVPFWCYCCFIFFLSRMPTTTKHDECSTTSFITSEVDIWKTEKSKKQKVQKGKKFQPCCIFIWLTTIDNKKERCRKIHWLGRQV